MPTAFDVRFPARAERTHVVVARGALDRLGRLTRATTGGTYALVVSDRTVAALYAARARRALTRAGIPSTLVVIPPGERSKQPDRLHALWRAAAAARLGRRDVVVALGGGVVGDLAGMLAATWLRGVPWVVVPTSLLAMVDSALGGKTGIDLPAGKNLVGAFHQPALVLADPDVLATLPARHRRAGLAEVVKTGLAADPRLFAWCERSAPALARGVPAALARAVERTLRVKGRRVAADPHEREGGGRTALNLGHTLGHAYEAARGYRGVLHGEAVAIGLRAATALSVAAGGLEAREGARVTALLDALGLPRRMQSVSLAALARALQHDKKRSARGVRWVLTPQIGHASVPRPIDRRLVRATLIAFGARS